MTSRRQRAEAEFLRLATNPAAFRDALFIDADAGRLPFKRDEWQEADFAALDPAWLYLAGRAPSAEMPTVRRAWIERPRGHSKTSDLAAAALWAIWAAARPISGLVAAADRDQAKLLRDAIERLIRCNPWLGRAIEVQAWRVKNKQTGSELEIMSSDVGSSYGLHVDFAIVDEITHHRSRDLWDSILSTIAKRERGVLVSICNAGHTGSWQWELREATRTDPGWHFSRLDGPVASWFSESTLAEQRRLLPDLPYRRLWLNQWVESSGDALSPEDLAAAVTLSGPQEPARGWVYWAALDLGLSRDASAVVVLGRHVGHAEEIREPIRMNTAERIIRELEGLPTYRTRWEEEAATHRTAVVAHRRWRPPSGRKIDLSAIEAEILRLHERYRFQLLAADPWQSAQMTQRLQRAGLFCVDVPFTGQNLVGMATATLGAFSERTIDLPDDPELLAELRSLQISEKSYGLRLEAPRGPTGHADVAVALSIGLHAGREIKRYTPGRIEGPLLVWPSRAG